MLINFSDPIDGFNEYYARKEQKKEKKKESKKVIFNFN